MNLFYKIDFYKKLIGGELPISVYAITTDTSSAAFVYIFNHKQGTGKGHGPQRPKGHGYIAGRERTFVPPEGKIGSYIDDHVFAGHTFAVNHDKFVDFAVNKLGLPDWSVNVVSMLPVYVVSALQEAYNLHIEHTWEATGAKFYKFEHTDPAHSHPHD